MKKRKNWFLLGIYVLVVIINVLSRYSRGFGNQVRRSVFYMTQYIQGHISSLFPFSLGDYLLILAVILAAGALVLAAVLLSVWVAGVQKVGGGNCGQKSWKAEQMQRKVKDSSIRGRIFLRAAVDHRRCFCYYVNQLFCFVSLQQLSGVLYA